MSHGELLMMGAICLLAGGFWIVGEMLSHGETPDDHLCSDGNMRPGPMSECSCRSDWAGLT